MARLDRGLRRAGVASALRHDLLHYTTGDVGQPKIAAIMAVGEPLVVDAQQVQHGGVDVGDVVRMLDGMASVDEIRARFEGQFAPPGFGDFATIFNPAYQGASDIFGFKTGQREAQLRDYTSALTYFDQRVNELFGGGIGGSVEDDSGGGFGGAGSVYGVLGGL